MSVTHPRFSIITCTWNSQKWLPASIQSVLMQTHENFEYIFVDGGSEDNTLDQIASITRPVYLIRHIRGGVSRAMNQGLKVATGDIVAFLHADDFYLHKHVLKNIDDIFKKTKCRWMFGRTMTAKNGNLMKEKWIAPRYSRTQLIRGNFISHPAAFAERHLLNQEGGFDEKLRYAMDYDLWLRLSRHAEPVQTDIPLAAFREHANSLSTMNKSAAMQEDFAVRLRYSSGDIMQNSLHYLRYIARRCRERYGENSYLRAEIHA